MNKNFVLLALGGSLFFTTGCAEGPFWRAGKYTPWATQQWEAEEQIADTLFARKRRMSEAVSQVAGGPTENQQKVALDLQKTVHSDPVLLMRLHAVKLAGQLNCPAAIQTLADASRDSNSDVRIAAVRSWEKMPAKDAVLNLQDIIGSDTDIDVRLAATRALSQFPGHQTVQALAMALEDRNPALQVLATESLSAVTGESIGRDVAAWQDYIAGTQQRSLPNDSIPALFGNPTGQTQIADQANATNELKR